MDHSLRQLERMVRSGSDDPALRSRFYRAAVRVGQQVVWRGGQEFDLVSRGKPVNGYFTSPAAQIDQVAEWNGKFKLGFTNGAIAAAWNSIPAWPKRELVAVQLVPYLPAIYGTFHTLWKIAASRQKCSMRNPWFSRRRSALRLLEDMKHPGRCLRWEVIDLGANWNKEDGIAPQYVRHPDKSPHAGILAAAAHHPEWVRAMDGKNVPVVWVVGYERGDPSSALSPDIYRRGDKFIMMQRSIDQGHTCHAVPEFTWQ